MNKGLRAHHSFLDPPVDHLIDLVEAPAQFGVVQNFDRERSGRGRVARFGYMCECKTGRCASPDSIRPMSRFSRITSSKNTRPVWGRSRIWVRENSGGRKRDVTDIDRLTVERASGTCP